VAFGPGGLPSARAGLGVGGVCPTDGTYHPYGATRTPPPLFSVAGLVHSPLQSYHIFFFEIEREERGGGVGKAPQAQQLHRPHRGTGPYHSTPRPRPRPPGPTFPPPGMATLFSS
jgi:hypothetical protein